MHPKQNKWLCCRAFKILVFGREHLDGNNIFLKSSSGKREIGLAKNELDRADERPRRSKTYVVRRQFYRQVII